jgi:hypothetical protein
VGEEETMGRENRANAQTQPCENDGFFHTWRIDEKRNRFRQHMYGLFTLMREEDFRGQFILSRPVL